MSDGDSHSPAPFSIFDRIDRREALGTLAACLAGGRAVAAPDVGPYRLATFSADVTPPLGHALMGGGVAPAKKIADPLYARGFVLLGAGRPIVLAAVDWCEIRNDAYERWREVLAKAAATEPGHVMVASLHQHDTPIADLTAQRLLNQRQATGSICDLDFHERAVQDVAQALRAGLEKAVTVTHIGTGQAKVEKVASNRRYLDTEGVPRFNRMSAARDPLIRDQPEGTIDPWLKTVSFWNGDRPVLALSGYATHPMSYYGQGEVSTDFVGLARKRRQYDEPSLFQIYVSGCSGNVTAGKYNDGTSENRPVLTERIYQAMVAAWQATERSPIERVRFRVVPLQLEPRSSPGFTKDDLEKRLANDPRPFGQCLAALGLSWRKRTDAGLPIDVAVLDLGKAKLLLLPGESYVEYQLLAQRNCPDSFVVTVGYGESAPGYIPTDKHFEEKDSNLNDWCWVDPGSEVKMDRAIQKALASVDSERL